jgi:phospholipid/cholesterol/gamma-HCH transport system substrate-binding protein
VKLRSPILRFAVGLAVLLTGTIAVIQVFVVAMGVRIVPHVTAPYTVAADFPDALGVRVGQQVLENGAVVGQVSGVDVQGRHAHVDMEFDGGRAPIHDSSSAQIIPTSQVGHPVIELDDPGYGNDLPSGRTLPLSRNHVPVYIDDIISGLNGDDRSGLRTVLRELGAAVDGRGEDIRAVTADTRAFLDGLTPISARLSDDSDHIAGILDHSHAVIGQLASSNLDGLIGDLGRLGATVSAQNPRLGSTLSAATTDLDTVNRMLQGNEANALHVLSSLPPVISAVDRTVTDFMPLLTTTLVPGEADIVQLIVELRQSFARVGSDGLNFLKVALAGNTIRSVLGGPGHGPRGYGSTPGAATASSPPPPDTLMSVLFGG